MAPFKTGISLKPGKFEQLLLSGPFLVGADLLLFDSEVKMNHVMQKMYVQLKGNPNH